MREPHRIIRWEEPPPTRINTDRNWDYPPSRWAEVAKELAANPGRSAVLLETGDYAKANTLAGNIRSGRTSCFEPRGDYAACTRKVDGQFVVYAWYAGDGAES